MLSRSKMHMIQAPKTGRVSVSKTLPTTSRIMSRHVQQLIAVKAVLPRGSFGAALKTVRALNINSPQGVFATTCGSITPSSASTSYRLPTTIVTLSRRVVCTCSNPYSGYVASLAIAVVGFQLANIHETAFPAAATKFARTLHPHRHRAQAKISPRELRP